MFHHFSIWRGQNHVVPQKPGLCPVRGCGFITCHVDVSMCKLVRPISTSFATLTLKSWLPLSRSGATKKPLCLVLKHRRCDMHMCHLKSMVRKSIKQQLIVPLIEVIFQFQLIPIMFQLFTFCNKLNPETMTVP